MRIYKEPIMLGVVVILAVISIVMYMFSGMSSTEATVDGVSPRTIEVIKESASGEE